MTLAGLSAQRVGGIARHRDVPLRRSHDLDFSLETMSIVDYRDEGGGGRFCFSVHGDQGLLHHAGCSKRSTFSPALPRRFSCTRPPTDCLLRNQLPGTSRSASKAAAILLRLLLGGDQIDLQLRATFSPTHPGRAETRPIPKRAPPLIYKYDGSCVRGARARKIDWLPPSPFSTSCASRTRRSHTP